MLKEVQWKNYKALGNLNLNFCKPDGNAYSTIILAGENGTGKTTILETIGHFLTGHSIEPFEYMEYDANNKSFRIEPLTPNERLGFHTRKEATQIQVKEIRTNHNNNHETMKNDVEDIRSYGCVYSSAKSKFDTKNIQGITSQHIDTTKYLFDDSNDFTSIKQLLVDIDAQDDKAYKQKNRLRNVPLSEFESESKMYKFKMAFNNFFEHIKYDRIDDSIANEQKVIFKKHGIDISVDNLSTGEKQIVFRGAYLLRNSGQINGGIILIDEPELSMHPKWQEKILSFYKNLFIRNNEQKAQLIIATHSEYVIREALKDTENALVIILKDENGRIIAKPSSAPYILPAITAAEVNFQAFNIYSIDYHIQLYGYMQSLTGNSCIQNMERYLSLVALREGLPNKNAIRDGRNVLESLPTYIRNAIDHPDNTSRNYSPEELKQSTDFLIRQIMPLRPSS